MKPRHSAEQSTTKVNKSEAMGRRGFAALRTMPTKLEQIMDENIPLIEHTPSFTQTASHIDVNGPLPKETTLASATASPAKEVEDASHLCIIEDPQDAMLCESCQ